MNQEKTPKKTYLPYLLAGAGLILIAIAGVAFGTSQARQDDSPAGEETGGETIFPPAELDRPAPELTLDSLDGERVSLADFRGEVVLVNNWATWCPPCRAEMPELNAYYHDHKEQGFRVVAVEAGDPAETVRAFVKEEGIDFTVLLDPENQSLKGFQNASLPNSYVIDRDGNLVLAWTGAINQATLEEHVTPLLEE